MVVSRRCSSSANRSRASWGLAGGGGGRGCGGFGGRAFPRRLHRRIHVEWIAAPGQTVGRNLVAKRDFNVEMALGFAAHYEETDGLDVRVIEQARLGPFCHGKV